MPESRAGAANTMRPNDYCTIAQATEIALRVSRMEIIRACGMDTESPVSKAYIDGPAWVDPLPAIAELLRREVRRERLLPRVGRWLRAHIPRVRIRR